MINIFNFYQLTHLTFDPSRLAVVDGIYFGFGPCRLPGNMPAKSASLQEKGIHPLIHPKSLQPCHR